MSRIFFARCRSAVDQQQHMAVRGTNVVSIASTANVPEPCIGTVT
jgi:hypothetical protein